MKLNCLAVAGLSYETFHLVNSFLINNILVIPANQLSSFYGAQKKKTLKNQWKRIRANAKLLKMHAREKRMISSNGGTSYTVSLTLATIS